MFEIGRVCIKTAGRDSNKLCVVTEKIDDHFVIVDGNTRKKKVNTKHIMPLKKFLEINKHTSHDEIVKLLDKIK